MDTLDKSHDSHCLELDLRIIAYLSIPYFRSSSETLDSSPPRSLFHIPRPLLYRFRSLCVSLRFADPRRLQRERETIGEKDGGEEIRNDDACEAAV